MKKFFLFFYEEVETLKKFYVQTQYNIGNIIIFLISDLCQFETKILTSHPNYDSSETSSLWQKSQLFWQLNDAGFPTWLIFQHLLTVEEEKNKHLVEQLQLVVEKFDQRNETSSQMENNLAEKLESAEKEEGLTLQNTHPMKPTHFIFS